MSTPQYQLAKSTRQDQLASSKSTQHGESQRKVTHQLGGSHQQPPCSPSGPPRSRSPSPTSA
eukprot:676927-Rhodomonas_salina.1